MKPDVFAAVMATGIVSIAAADHGYSVCSDVLAVLAGAGLPILAVAAVVLWSRRPPDVGDPDVAVRLYTFVAACAVLDSRLTANWVVLWTLSVLASASWLVCGVLTARSFASRSWDELQQRARGAWELASVGTSGLAIVGVLLAHRTGWHSVLLLSLTVWVLALVLYLVMTALILARAFAARLDPRGFEPDAWILMGGLAIATLAGDHLHRAGIDGVRLVTIATWAVATAWIPPLLVFGWRHLRRPESRHFAGVWWAMVFPLGMYSAATFATAVETNWSVLEVVSLVFCWIALALWVVVTVAGLTRLVVNARSHGRSSGVVTGNRWRRGSRR